jgi:hypothetical protein
MLMFGWFTAVLFEVLRKTLDQLAVRGEAMSTLSIKTGKLVPIEQHDLALSFAEEADGIEFV